MASGPGLQRSCRLVDGGKLPLAADAAHLCDTVERAIEHIGPRLGYEIEIHVLSPSSLAATVKTADGRTMPEQRLRVYDRQLTRQSIARFATSIASELARASR